MTHTKWLVITGISIILAAASMRPSAHAAPQDSRVSADVAAVDESAAQPANEQRPDKPVPLPKVKWRLTPGQAALRDQARQALEIYRKQPFGTRQNTAGEIMDYCLPYGCATEISLYDNSGERRANGITCLCWNYPGGGFEPLALNDGRIAARLGYGAQSQPSQLLATLAFARVQANYPLRVENAVRTVADLVESEKLACRAGADLSLKLVGLSFYAEDAAWKNDLGEEWSVERIIREELNRPVLSEADRGLNRLMGLAYANYRREKRNQPLDGQYARAEKYLSDFHQFAFNLQNADGSWGYFLAARGANKNAAAQLRSSAYVFEWLAFSLPAEQLGDARVAAAIGNLVQGLNAQRNRGSAANLPAREINAIAHALHALSICDERYYQNAEEEKPAAEKSSTEITAAKSHSAPSQTKHYSHPASSRK
ncbi:MAG: hypothetical protein IT426_13135 [Pirellulales bacterium]|nr:hypothetical protein [Pirellulales bacterium]